MALFRLLELFLASYELFSNPGQLLTGKSVTECLLPSDMMLDTTHAHLTIAQFKTICYYADLMNETEDPVERLKLLTAANLGRQIELPLYTAGMPPIPVPVGSTLSAELKNGAVAYFEHIGPKMVNSALQIIGNNGSFKLYSTINVRIFTLKQY